MRLRSAWWAVMLCCISGCSLVPPPPPSASTGSLGGPLPASPQTASLPTQSPVAVEGFTSSEQAALRVRNVGCGAVKIGSGFAISDHTFVTNRHVVGGAAVLQVSGFDGHDIKVTSAGAAVVADLALVRTVEPLPATIKLAAENPAIGSPVTAVGFPLGGPLTTTHGHVLGYARDPIGWSSLPMLRNDAPIEHGSSGSALLDDRGQLVGVVYATSGHTNEYAVPVDVLRSLISNSSTLGQALDCDGAPPPAP